MSIGHDFGFGVYCVGRTSADAVVAYFAEFWYPRVFFYFGVCVGESYVCVYGCDSLGWAVFRKSGGCVFRCSRVRLFVRGGGNRCFHRGGNLFSVVGIRREGGYGLYLLVVVWIIGVGVLCYLCFVFWGFLFV